MAIDYIVRPARPSDAPQLRELNRLFNGDDVSDEALTQQRLSAPGPERCLVCERGDRLLGFACAVCFSSFCYVHPVGELTELFVLPEARRMGVGRALVRAMIERLRGEGATEIRLLTGWDNHAAQALYEQCGFRPVDERYYELE